MKKTIGAILAGIMFCFATNALALAPAPAAMGDEYVIHDDPMPVRHKAAVHHKKRAKKRHTRKTSHASPHSHVRTAQVYLDQLGYDPGAADGLIGPRTKTAIKGFQRDHNLRATGTLTDATFRALAKEAGNRNPMRNSEAPQPNFLATHPDFYGYYGTEGTNPTTLGSPQTIPSRYGTIDISEEQTGQAFRYTFTLNGQPIYHADNQPSFVNVSRTFNLDEADAVLVTSYASGNSVCPYSHHLLVVRATGSGVHDIADCTRDYTAYTQNGMLLISFPGDHVDGLSNGAAWRYDHGTLEKL